MIKLISMLLICFLGLCSKPFKIIEVNSQKYVAGRKESGGGINYSIKLITRKSSDKLDFDKITISNHDLKIRIMSGGKFVDKYTKGDTLYLISTLVLKPDNRNDYPENIMNECINLGFRYKDKMKCVSLIPEIITTQMGM